MQPTARPTHKPARACHPSAWLKVEAVCCALFFCGLGRKAAPKTFAGSSEVAWPWRRTKREKFLRSLFRATAILILFFPSLPAKVFVTPFALGRSPFLRSSVIANSHKKKCLHQMATTASFAGVGCGGHLFFVRALSPPAFPRNPHAGRRGRGC